MTQDELIRGIMEIIFEECYTIGELNGEIRDRWEPPWPSLEEICAALDVLVKAHYVVLEDARGGMCTMIHVTQRAENWSDWPPSGFAGPPSENLGDEQARDEWRVCPECRGEGKVVHPALSVWTQEDRMNDPDGFDSMLRGEYDRTCAMCKGKRVVKQKQVDDFSELYEDERTRGMESGDPELFYNPRQGMY